MGKGWQAQALCRDLPTELFYDELEPAAVERAKKVCAACTVRVACLREALSRRDQDGIWGGTTPKERKRIRRHRVARAS